MLFTIPTTWSRSDLVIFKSADNARIPTRLTRLATKYVWKKRLITSGLPKRSARSRISATLLRLAPVLRTVTSSSPNEFFSKSGTPTEPACAVIAIRCPYKRMYQLASNAFIESSMPFCSAFLIRCSQAAKLSNH